MGRPFPGCHPAHASFGEDATAAEKPAEGSRRSSADARKLEQYAQAQVAKMTR